MENLSKIDENFLKIPRRFLADLNTEFEISAVIFGGAVRDSLLGYEPKDVDILLPSDGLFSNQTLEKDLLSWIKSNPFTINGSVSVKQNSNYGGKLINASFKGPMRDIKIQLIPETNFTIYKYLDESNDVATNAVLIPNCTCNRVAINERADIFCEDEYMENLNSSMLGIAHQISNFPPLVVRRLIRFSATRGLKLDYSAIEYINAVTPWGKKGDELIDEILDEAVSSKSILTSGTEINFDFNQFKDDLYLSLGRKK